MGLEGVFGGGAPVVVVEVDGDRGVIRCSGGSSAVRGVVVPALEARGPGVQARLVQAGAAAVLAELRDGWAERVEVPDFEVASAVAGAVMRP